MLSSVLLRRSGPNNKTSKRLIPPTNKNTTTNSTPQDSEPARRKKTTCTHNNPEHLTGNIKARNTIKTKQMHAPMEAELRKELNKLHFTMERTLVNIVNMIMKLAK